MPALAKVPSRESNVWPIENDLPTVALNAATELDNLLLHRAETFDAVQQLLETLGDSVTEVDQPASPSSLLDPTTAVVLNRAIGAYTGGDRPTELGDLLAQAGKITEQLKEILDAPTMFATQHSEETKRLRSFCVALSRQALASCRSMLERPDHPFRT